MSIECSIFAVTSEQIASFRDDPQAASNEALLRNALDHMSAKLHFQPDLTEAEFLAQLGSDSDLAQIDDPQHRAELAAHYNLERALLESAVARGDRETPFCLGKSWDSIHQVVSGGDPNSGGWFLVGGEPLGDALTYGPPCLRSPEDVAAFARYLGGWSGRRFLAALEALRPEGAGVIDPSSLPPSYRQQWTEIAKMARESEAALFEQLKAYIVDASDARAGMLIWLN